MHVSALYSAKYAWIRFICQSLRIPLTQKIGFKRPKKGSILQYLCLLTQNLRLFVRISDSSPQPEFSDTLIIPSGNKPQNIILISLQYVYPSNTSIFILTTICVCMTCYLLSCNTAISQCFAINNTRKCVDYILILDYFVIN